MNNIKKASWVNSADEKERGCALQNIISGMKIKRVVQRIGRRGSLV